MTRLRILSGVVVAMVAAALAMAAPAHAAQLTCTPGAARSGETVGITGKAFAPNSNVTLRDDNVVVASNILTNNAGDFTTSYTVPPNSTVKRHVLRATDAQNNVAECNLDVTAGGGGGPARISVNPSTAPSGATVALEGENFADNETVSVIMDTGQEIARPTTNGGRFSTTFVVPSVSTGTHTITARGLQSQFLASTQLTVDGGLNSGGGCGPGGACFYNTTPTAGPGQQIALYGRGYQPGEGIVVTADNGATVATTTADGQGNWSTTGRVPDNLSPGQHQLIARGTASGREDSDPVRVVDSYGQGSNVAYPPGPYPAPPGAGAPYPPGAYPTGPGYGPPGVYPAGVQAVRPGAIPPAATRAAGTGRIPFTGAKVLSMTVIALFMLLGGLLLLAARAKFKPAPVSATSRIFQRPSH